VLGGELFWSRDRPSTPQSVPGPVVAPQPAATSAVFPAIGVPPTGKVIATGLPAALKGALTPPAKSLSTVNPVSEVAKSERPLTPRVAAPAGHTREVVLSHVLGSTVKLEQLIGDEDKERHKPTLNQTLTRYGLQGADLGYSFEHQGLAYFLFGTTIGRENRSLGTIATTMARDPEPGVPLDFLTNNNQYLDVAIDNPRRANNGMFQAPVSGISVGGQMYVAVRRLHPLNRNVDRSFLTKFVSPATFQQVRLLSELPAGRFIKTSMHAEPGPVSGAPDGGPFIFIWGTGEYRQSDAFLSIVPEAEFESGKGTRYFSGLDASGSPSWSDKESDAMPVLKDGSLGDVSVTWCKDLNLWLMMYDSRKQPVGVMFSYSRTPWGPWSAPQVVFNMVRDGGLGRFIHKADTDDGVAGPVLALKNHADPGAIRGAAYAPYVVERWTKVDGSHLSLYYVLSTNNPYVVVLMKSRFDIE
jgi:hypothetical protein